MILDDLSTLLHRDLFQLAIGNSLLHQCTYREIAVPSGLLSLSAAIVVVPTQDEERQIIVNTDQATTCYERIFIEDPMDRLW